MAKPWVVALALLCTLVGFAVGWLTRPVADAPAPPTGPAQADVPAAGPPRDSIVDGPKRLPPDRPPEFVGVVESVRPEVIGGRVTARLYIRCQAPPADWPQPTDSYQRDGNRLWVSLHDAEIDQRGGLAPGSVARVWHRRDGVMFSNPPGYNGQYVQTEAAFK